ncbi:Epoxide hydrolase [Fulvia fulva]|uniref:Epoxide hydrolase n=1 Tax=Passalora fulva TaxID=5499 RepID=A0A9Q8PET4_PASFU|nr:Epoxide hydrolase [Fulvia fulva]KAK4618243.1 Epoxide hydrolase [Fulvia fulva]KAK4618418.1 Epoxide hydrolase [Fulvia fulva]UJO21139.1 Epoxide hydrolase [Fulvia fulva]WPV17940.1 Epoxide hydrolase [Fulvia fulva]WPV32747.1 Epoxide hydrolase [Fulvia fulva]
MLLDGGFRVVAPDMLGYGDSARLPDAPGVPPESIRVYAYKNVADDIRELARQLECTTIILGGHDWYYSLAPFLPSSPARSSLVNDRGAQVAWRVAQWHPSLVSRLFTIAGPYRRPTSHWTSFDDLVKAVPQLAYQKQIASGILEQTFCTTEGIRDFLKILDFSGDAQNQTAFEPTRGFDLEHLQRLGKGSLLTDQELEVYVAKYSRNGLHGPCNWYRTRRANFEDDQSLLGSTIDIPVLYIAAARDRVFSPSLTHDMEQCVPQLLRASVDAHHYAHVEKWQDVNGILSAWLRAEFHGSASLVARTSLA